MVVLVQRVRSKPGEAMLKFLTKFDLTVEFLNLIILRHISTVAAMCRDVTDIALKLCFK